MRLYLSFRGLRCALLPAALCAAAGCAQRSQPASPTYASTPTEPAPAPATTAGAIDHDMHANCPMDVQGAVVTSENIDGGIALVFTTQSGDIADLRSRVQRIATDVDQAGAGTAPVYPDVNTDTGSTGQDVSGPGPATGPQPSPGTPTRRTQAGGTGSYADTSGSTAGATPPGTTTPGTTTPGTTTSDPSAPGTMHGQHGSMTDMLTGNIAVDVDVTDLVDGARLELKAESSADVESLRARVREHATQMAGGTCPGMDKAG